MRPNPFSAPAFSLVLLSLPVAAAGFGEMTLLSRLGEPLQAEVEVIGDDRQAVNSACFSLARISDSDLPALTTAHIRLVREEGRARLFITSPQPVSDPVFVLGLRAGCGVALQRDFVLMPALPPVTPPENQPEAEPVTATDHRGPPAGQEPPPRKKRLAGTPALPKPLGGDRLVLGAPPADMNPRPAAPSRQDSLADMERRMQDMEKTLGLLHQSMDKLAEALALTAETVALQQKLEQAQVRQHTPPATLRVAAAAETRPTPSSPMPSGESWLELATSILLGSVAAALAMYFRTRRRRSAEAVSPPPLLVDEAQQAASPPWPRFPPGRISALPLLTSLKYRFPAPAVPPWKIIRTSSGTWRPVGEASPAWIISMSWKTGTATGTQGNFPWKSSTTSSS